MNKKGEFEIQSFLIGVVLFIGIVVTFASLARQMSIDYSPVVSTEVSAEFEETYNKLDTIESTTEDVQGKVLDTQTGETDAASEFFGDALNTLKVIATSLSTTSTLMQEMSVSLGINEFWLRILSLILFLMLFTIIIYMIFRYRG